MTDLILIPTPREQRTLIPLFQASGDSADWAFQLCGFGPIAAAARAAALISRYKPDRVLLIGIAGSFDVETFPVGSACRFEQVACYGIGVGSGESYRGVDAMGLNHFAEDNVKQFSGDARPTIGDVIPLTSTYIRSAPLQGQLLTACACSECEQDVMLRKNQFPDAIAEDMEGFGVAMACTLAGVPLQIVRGISNQVGDRNHADWKIDEALHAAAKLAMEIMPWRWIPTET